MSLGSMSIVDGKDGVAGFAGKVECNAVLVLIGFGGV